MFTFQLGTVEQKEKLTCDYLGVDLQTFKHTMKCYSGKISCIYFISLGSVGNLRNTFNIRNVDNNNIVCKYGRTNDIKRRLSELSNEYRKKNSIITINILSFVFINDKFSSRAEKEVADKFISECHKILDITENELVAIKPQYISNVSQYFKRLEKKYGDGIEHSELTRELEHEKRELINEKKIMDYERRLLECGNKNLLLMSENEKLKMIIENKSLELELLKCKLTKTF
jgi:hypothetical protein